MSCADQKDFDQLVRDHGLEDEALDHLNEKLAAVQSALHRPLRRVQATDSQIRQLRAESAQAGDLAQVALCLLALGEDPADADPGTDLWMLGERGVTQEQARARCADVIAYAQGEASPPCRLCGRALDLSGQDVSGADAHQTCQQSLEEGIPVEEIRARYE